jgi:hypothetical protein
MQTIEKLQAEYDKLSKKHHKRLMASPDGMDFHEFQNYMAVTADKLETLSQDIRMLQVPKMKPITDSAMTMAVFLDYVKSGSLIDYDGFGRYATETEESDIMIFPSDVKAGKIRKDFTHVCWYNK